MPDGILALKKTLISVESNPGLSLTDLVIYLANAEPLKGSVSPTALLFIIFLTRTDDKRLRSITGVTLPSSVLNVDLNCKEVGSTSKIDLVSVKLTLAPN